jgi:hypothetical protein
VDVLILVDPAGTYYMLSREALARARVPREMNGGIEAALRRQRASTEARARGEEGQDKLGWPAPCRLCLCAIWQLPPDGEPQRKRR